MIQPGSLRAFTLGSALAVASLACDAVQGKGPLDPRGEVHVPIGLADSVDVLKTFVEAEGNFSPGFATYGIYFWLYDRVEKQLFAPTFDGVPCDRGLAAGGRSILDKSMQRHIPITYPSVKICTLSEAEITAHMVTFVMSF